MKKNLLIILGLVVAFVLPVNAGTLTLGNFNNQKIEGSWDGFNLQNAPVIFTYQHSGTQVLYQPQELAEMKGKQITSLSFKCFSENCFISNYTSTMKIFLQEMDANEFFYNEPGEYYEWVEFDHSKVIATTEFRGDFLASYQNVEDIEVKFDLSQNPYTYTGKTLVVTIVNDAPTCIEGTDGAVRFYWIDYTGKEQPWSSCVFASDDKDFFTNQAKDNAIKTIDNEDKWKNAPAVQFTYKDAKSTPFSGGEGTVQNPYLISSLDDLSELDDWSNQDKTKGVYFKLTKDITEVPFTGMIGSNGVFEGNFNGDNHCIAVDINFPDMNYVGLFGYVVGATITNLQVKGNVTGGFYVGGVFGQIANDSHVEYLVNYCNVTGSYFVGGIAGQVITQTPSASCTLTQCANFGTINAKNTAGGIAGDCGQQVGNKIQRIANYGIINGVKKSGGLIGNCRAYDQVYFGINASTAINNTVQGCIGNTISSTIGDLYYDAQYINNPKANPVQVKQTAELIGNNLMSKDAKSGFSENYWVFAENLYPRLKINGLENSDIFKLYATPVLLATDNTLDNITADFNVVTDNGVQWTSKNNKVAISGNKVTPIALGEDILVATLNNVSREIKINVTKFNGIDNLMNDNLNSVVAEAGKIVVKLSHDALVQVFNVAGQTMANGYFTEGENEILLNRGIYIVKVANETFKVCVME